jgi:hypothetical protein
MKKNKMGGNVARVGQKRNECRVLVGKPEGKRTLGKRMLRCKYNCSIKIDLKEKEWRCAERILVAGYRGNEPFYCITCT